MALAGAAFGADLALQRLMALSERRWLVPVREE